MSLYDFSSEGIGSRDVTYLVAHAPKVRKRWMLMACRPTFMEHVAFFRSEQHARDFAATFGLTITDHRKDTT